MGDINTIETENMTTIDASRVGIKNSPLWFFINTQIKAKTMPIAQILKLSLKVQTHPLFDQKDHQFHRQV